MTQSMDEHKDEVNDQMLSEDCSDSDDKLNIKSYQSPGEDAFPPVDDDDDLDDEVRSCLIGFPSYRICTQTDSQVDSMSTSSFYSSGTLRGADTDTASYCSVDTLRGSEVEEVQEEPVQREQVQREQLQDKSQFEDISPQSSGKSNTSQEVSDLPRDEHLEYHHNKDITKLTTNHPDLSYSRPSYLAGSRVSVTTGSSYSLVSEEEVSFAGQVNDRLGKLLGYVGLGTDGVHAEDALANIMGYEIVSKEKEKFTIYKIRVSCLSLMPGTWVIHRRYSDFLQIRKTLIKENPFLSKISFPPKRWVGSNLEPAFLGRRLAGLQVFLASVLEIKELRSNQALVSFLCLDKPPVAVVNCLEENRAICDTLEEAVKELREQLRKREQLEMEMEHQKHINGTKDQQIENLYKENILLRHQKESLLNVLSSGRRSSSSRNLADSSKLRIETLEDFTTKFNLKSGEGPLASSTPFKSSHGGQTGLGARRRIYSQGEVLPGEDPPHEKEKI